MREPHQKRSVHWLLEKIFLLGIYKRHEDVEQARRLLLTNSFTLLAIIILLIVGIYTYKHGNTIVALSDLSAAALLLICLFIVRGAGSQQLGIYMGMSIMTILYFFLFVTGGADNTGFIFYYTYPLFTLYILGKRDGSIFNAILLLPSFAYLVLTWSAENPRYSHDFTVRFIPSLLCVFIFAFMFEATRKKAHTKLRTKQDQLQASNTTLRQKEIELHKAYNSLESQVEKRTRELKRSNQELKREIAQRRRSENQRKKLETQLVQAKKMQAIGTLAGGVAHDLNNILSGITSYPELLLYDLPTDSHLRGPLETIQQSGQKAATIVQDLLTLSRQSMTVFHRLDLDDVVSDYLDSPEFKKMVSFHKGVTVRTRFTDPPFTITGSAVHLSKVIMNLISNAAEAMPNGGEVVIELKGICINAGDQHIASLEAGRYVQLMVEDSGTGMPPDVRDRIFEPFFTTKKLGRSGSGLGMAVVWGTVAEHFGHIDVRSAPRKGTSFHLYFPAVEPVTPKRRDAAAPLPKGNNQTILVVDDVAEQRKIATEILNNIGYNAMAMASGETAVAYLQEADADLVILDMNMDPGIDGHETLRQILAFNPSQRAIITSGYTESSRIEEVLGLGARTYIKKPYRIDSIAIAVNQALSDD